MVSALSAAPPPTTAAWPPSKSTANPPRASAAISPSGRSSSHWPLGSHNSWLRQPTLLVTSNSGHTISRYRNYFRLETLEWDRVCTNSCPSHSALVSVRGIVASRVTSSAATKARNAKQRWPSATTEDVTALPTSM